MSQEDAEATLLGKETEYKFLYNPAILVAVPRQENRTGINIKDGDLPFVGVDVWNAYEISTITEKGVPFAGFAKIVYPCDSEFLIESKSLKLYLNSFNMSRFGETTSDALVILQAKIAEDLSKVLKTGVQVTVFDAGWESEAFINPVLNSSIDLDATIAPDMECTAYNEDSSILEIEDALLGIRDEVHSHVLRSNCKITHQPDWGSVYIVYTSPVGKITWESLFKYLVSMRGENHFHEEICEAIYKRLYDLLQPTELVVACFYTRRGGIDINPVRALSNKDIETCGLSDYIDSNQISPKTARQ